MSEEPADALLRDLVRGAARTEIAEGDLENLKARMLTLNVEIPSDDMDSSRSGYVANRIASMIAANDMAMRVTKQADGLTRFTVTIVLERAP